MRDGERFRHITPESIVFLPPLVATVGLQSDSGGEIWLDWGFVEFWKSNYCESFNCSKGRGRADVDYRYRPERALYRS